MRRTTRTGRGRAGALCLGVALALGACGDDPADIDTTPDPAIAPFVGDWRASAMVLTNKANPSVAPDLIAEGAQFDLNVQPSGQYTAILTYQQQASTEIGFLSVSGSVVTLQRTFPSAQTSTASYSFSGSTLTLVGDSEFDFNLDGTPEEATAEIVLQKR